MFSKILDKLGFCIVKDSNRSFLKDIIVLVACLAFWIGAIVFFFTEAGQSFFGELKKNLPFMNILADTINDLNKLMGQAFQVFGLQSPLTGIEAEAQAITLVKLFIDLSKLMLSNFIQSLLFLLCSYLFLYAKNKNLILGMLGGEKKDVLYHINSFLLMGITVLVGGVSATFVMTFIASKVSLVGVEIQHYASFGIFVLIYLLYSIYSMLTSKLASGGSFTFKQSLLKTLAYNLVPEMLTFFVTNLLVVVMLNCFVTLGFHILSLGALLAFWVWCWLADIIESVFTRWFNSKIPFMGKYCPLSGIFWLGGTLAVCMLFYFAAFANLGSTSGSVLEDFMYTLPFLQDWASGASLLDLIMNNFGAYIPDIINLIIICTVVSAFQYFSSSYIPTLFLQIFARLLFLMGCAMVCMLVTYAISGGLVIPWVQSSDVKGFLIFMFTCLYFMFFAFQPFLALQGVLSAGCVVLLLNAIPASSIYTDTEAGFGMFLGASLIAIGVGCLLPLLQNIVAVLEKKFLKSFYMLIF